MAQNNAAQAIRDLAKNLETADIKVKALSSDVTQYFNNLTAAITAAARSGNASFDQMFEYITRNTKAMSAKKIRLQFDIAKAKADIGELEAAIKSKTGGVTLFSGEEISGIDKMRTRLGQLRTELTNLQKQSKKSVEQMTDDLIKTVNDSVGKRTTYSPINKQRVKDEKEVQKIQEDVTKTLQRRKELEDQIGRYSEGSKSKKLRELRAEWTEVNKLAQEYLSRLGSLGTAGSRALKGFETAGLLTNTDKTQLEIERQQIDLLRQRMQAEQQLQRFLQQRANLQLSGKQVPSRVDDSISRLQTRIDAIDKQRLDSYQGFTQTSLQRIEGMWQNHENTLTNIKNRGEQERRRLSEQQIVALMKEQMQIDSQLNKLRNAPQNQDVQSQIQNLTAQYNALGQQINNVANGNQQMIASARQQLSLQEQSMQNAQQTTNAIRAAREEESQQAKQKGKAARDAEKFQNQANSIVKKRIDLEAQVQRIDNDRDVRQQTNSRVSQQTLQAESERYDALIQRINQYNRALSRIESKKAGATAIAEATNRPYENYVYAKEEERKQKAIDETTNKLKKQKVSLDSILMTVRRIGYSFGLYFSARGLVQFGKKLIETRGEFEMQFVAMKQIIGDVDEATKIWGQTMQQSLKSPFKAMQLVTYTKQLAAYRVETEKLFETTKRLADVSAGLGVDMGRLILAYGQVKAANYLRASEIRQFTEAGVNILGELSKYFTETQGRAISTAQVMEMVTKRMVTFADVSEIFKRMTDEGGAFFNMQEIQANTVRGQLMKLHDAYDQMLNKIGQSNQGTIRNIIGLLNKMAKNWEKVVFWVKLLVGLFATYKVAQVTAAVGMIRAGKAADAEALGMSGLIARIINLIAVEKTATDTTLTLSTALKQLNSSKGGWIGVAISAALTIAISVYDYVKRASQLSKELNKITAETQMRSRKSTTDYEQMAEKIRDVNTSEKERQETLSKLKQMYEDILPSRMLDIEYITKEGNAYDDAKESIRAYYEEKRKQESLDEVYEEYGKYVEKAREDFIEVYKTVYGYAHVNLKDSDINAVVDELIQQYENGELVLSNYTETFEKLIQLQSGVDLTDKLTWKSDDDAVFYFERIISALETLDDKIKEVTGSTADFLGEQNELLKTNVFVEAEKNLSDSIASLSRVGFLKSFNEELESQIVNYEDFARLAYETFKETFKEEYEVNPIFFDDLFEKELEKRLGNLGIELKKNWEKNGKVIKHSIVDNQKTINSEIEKLAKQTSISDKEILRQFQVDTSVEFDEWIKNQLSKIDLYKTDLLRIQKGLTSNMTDEHIAMLQTLEPFLPLWEEYLKGLTPTKKTKTGRKTHENASKLISLIKEMRSEYDKLSKSAYGYAKSEETVRDAYKDSVKEILGKAGITDYDFTTNEGMIAALEKVKSYATKLGKDAAAEVQKYIDQLETEIEINAQVRIREDFGKQMEDMFNNYQLTVELQGLGIDENLAKEWLNTTYTSLGDILDEANNFANGLIEKDNFAEKDLEKYKKYVDKVEAEILKTRKEKTKEYSKYLEKELSERAKKEMEFAIKFAEVQGAQIFTEDQKNAILSNMEDDYTKAMQELTWKSFKESTFYVEMMDDLTSIPADYSKLMLAKINELLMSPQVLSPRAFKEAINARQKILEAQMQLKPLKTMVANRDLVNAVFADESFGLKKRGTMGGKRRELDKEILARTKNIDILEKEAEQYSHLTAQVEAYEKAETKATNAMKDVGLTLEGATGESVQQEIDNRKDRLDLLKKEEERYKELKEIQGAGGLTDAQQKELKELANDSNERSKKIEGLKAEIDLLGEAKQAVLSYCSALDVLNQPENEDALLLINGGNVTTVGGNVVNRGNLPSQQQENKNQLKNQKNALQRLKEARKGTIEWVKSWHTFNAQLNDTIGKVKDMGNAFYDTYEALGGETDALTDGWKEFGNTMVEVIVQALQMIPTLVTGFTAAGVSINSAMGIIGLIAEAIQLVLVLITGIAKLHDAGYEQIIEQQQEKIDNLTRAYERLERQIDKTFETTAYMRDYNEMTANLYAQVEALNKQISAEEAKKNSDKDKIQGYKDAIQDAIDDLEDLKQKQIEVFGGIGAEGYRDAAQEFVDAWKSAFLETGDGLQGLQEHFDEFLNDWFTKQLTMKYAAAALKPLFSMMDAAVDQYGPGGVEVIQQELDEMREWAKVYFPQIADELEKNANIWSLDGEGGLSGLAAGIQGMTEEQANILEAYWNSVRGYTASIDANVATIVGLLSNGTEGVGDRGGISGGVDYNPMLQQITLVAQNTNSINTLLQAVTKSGHSMGGQGIKVFVN